MALEETVSNENSAVGQGKYVKARVNDSAENQVIDDKEESPNYHQLANRVAKLERRGETLDRQVLHLLKTSRVDTSDLNAEQAPVVAAKALEAVMNDPGTAEQLRSIIREEQDLIWQERRDRRWEKRRERLDEEIQALNEMLELTGSEAESFNKMLVSENETIRGFWLQVRSGELSRSQARQATRLRRVETDNQVKDLLDENRYASFENWRNERFRRNRR